MASKTTWVNLVVNKGDVGSYNFTKRRSLSSLITVENCDKFPHR